MQTTLSDANAVTSATRLHAAFTGWSHPSNNIAAPAATILRCRRPLIDDHFSFP